MKIIELLKNLKTQSIHGDLETQINQIQFDSRKIEKNDVYVALKGTIADGHQFIKQAIQDGAKAIVCEKLPVYLESHIVYIQVENAAQALGILAANFYGNPSKKLKLVGVTGTNGKTTVVTILYKLFKKLGYNVGLISTIHNKIKTRIYPSTHTTPNPVELNRLLAEMVKKRCTHVFMEVSSHAVVQKRIEGIHFKGAVFMNISHDHLDYHGTFAEYIRAKKGFFDMLPTTAFALVNQDDRRGLVMLQNCMAKHVTFSMKSMSDYKVRIMDSSFEGMQLQIEEKQNGKINGKETWTKLIGNFNAYNLLAVYGVAMLLEEDEDEILTELSNIKGVSGRFQRYTSSLGVHTIVDYAHTPDALENILKTITEIKKPHQHLITVVGCGGDRDKTKRPEMAQLAANYSDWSIFTSDNPRTEEPEAILKDMLEGIKEVAPSKYQTIISRKEAIERACSIAQKDDIILVAGKGHETYQEINGERFDFDDRIVLKESLE
jgi:UDP-N-acetylmuramoyl-L-alanyl-D-glutamate--2,6-diaminopimelate ligase